MRDTSELSSGNVTADRRADYARMLLESGDMQAAADLMAQALELAPDWAAGWFRLADALEKAGDAQGAIIALDRVLALDPSDLFGAGLKRALLAGAPAPAAPSSRYVARLFDDYAHRFEAALVERLHYVVPERLAALLPQGPFGTGVDLGCGTGLFGPHVRARLSRLEGYDLSGRMLAKAAEKRVYDHLAIADLAQSPETSGLFAEGFPPGRAGLVSAADVLMYLGDLTPFVRLADALLAPCGFLAFSIEEAADASADFTLQPSLRYAHGEGPLLAKLAAHGFTTLRSERLTIRMDGGKPVAGMLFLASKSG